MASNTSHTTEGNVTYMHTPQTIELDGKALRAEAQKSPELLTLLTHGAKRHRNREITDIEQMRNAIMIRYNQELSYDAWVAAFKKLEEMGMGALIFGRHGNARRFRWNYSFKSIGTAAVNGQTLTTHRIVPKMRGGKMVNDYHSGRSTFLEHDMEEDDELPTPVKAAPSKPTPALPKPAPKVIQAAPAPRAQAAAPQPKAATPSLNMVFVALRPDFTFETDLPNLTEREADVICNAIRRCVK
jgi:hypothetical protein